MCSWRRRSGRDSTSTIRSCSSATLWHKLRVIRIARTTNSIRPISVLRTSKSDRRIAHVRDECRRRIDVVAALDTLANGNLDPFGWVSAGARPVTGLFDANFAILHWFERDGCSVTCCVSDRWRVTRRATSASRSRSRRTEGRAGPGTKTRGRQCAGLRHTLASQGCCSSGNPVGR